MVGTTLAGVLANREYKVALVEEYPHSSARQSSFDDRAIALSWGSTRILKQLKLWSEILSIAEPIKTIHISDRGHFGLSRIYAEDERVPALGYVVSANDLGRVLVDSITQKQSNRLQVFCPAKAIAIRHDSDCVTLQIQQRGDTQAIQSKLVIAADGAESSVRKLLGVGYSRNDYQQDAIIANITPEFDHKNIAYERFTETGPIAMLPMQSHNAYPRCALVWTVPRVDSSELMQVDDAAFLSRLQDQFGYRLGRLCAVGQRSQYALSLTSSDSRVEPRVAFIGNAAQAVHPVAGQGFNLALRDMSALLDCLLYPASVADAGSAELLQDYLNKRRADQQRVIRFTDALVKAFSNNVPVFSQARAASLILLDSLPPLRRKLIHLSMGLHTSLPRI